MNPSFVQKQLASNLIREGQLFKRSKFLKVWEERWLVLTVNYLFIYQDKSRKVLTDSIDLNEVKNYKSYVRKEDDVLTNCLKIRSDNNMYYLGFGSVLEKWTWIVTLQRLMDVKVQGKNQYNCQEWIATRGFPSQSEFQGVLIGKGHENEVEKLKKQLADQEKFFENVLKQKYKELNVIEDKMKQRQKYYEQLSAELVAKLEEANVSIKLAEEQVRQAQSKTQLTQLLLLQSNAQMKELERKLLEAVEAEEREKIKAASHHRQRQQEAWPKVHHQIKSSYKQELVESMLGHSLSPKDHENLTFRATIIQEPLTTHQTQSKEQSKQPKISPATEQENISAVETVLGFSIPPAQHSSIHTDGRLEAAQIQAKIVQIIDTAIIQSLKQEIEDLRAQLERANEQIIQANTEKIVEILIPQEKLPEVLHEIRASHQFDLVESLLGYTLPPHARSNLHLKASIVEDEESPLEEVIVVMTEETPDNPYHSKISAVETLLGYSIPPAHYQHIHTDGRAEESKEEQEREQKQEREQEERKQQEDVEEKYYAVENLLLQSKINELSEQLERKNQELQQAKDQIEKLTAKPSEPSVSHPLPQASHAIKSSFKFDIIESLLGFTLSPDARTKLHINANIIEEEQPPKAGKPAEVARSAQDQDSKVSAVETILGYSIPPKRYIEIHTDGAVPISEVKEVVNELQLQNEELRIQLAALNIRMQEQQLVFTATLQEKQALIHALEAEKQSLIDKQPEKIASNSVPPVEHVIRSTHKLETVQSILGFSLAPSAEQALHLNANIIDEPIPNINKERPPKVEQQQRQNNNHGKIEAVQTLLGFAIPPLRYAEIHTEGNVPARVVQVVADLAIANEGLSETVTDLMNKYQLIQQELLILRGQYLQQASQYDTLKQFNQITAKQAERVYLESQQLKKTIAEHKIAEESFKKELQLLTKKLQEQQSASTLATAQEESEASIFLEKQALLLASEVKLRAELKILESRLEEESLKLNESSIEINELTQTIKVKTDNELLLLAQVEALKALIVDQLQLKKEIEILKMNLSEQSQAFDSALKEKVAAITSLEAENKLLLNNNRKIAASPLPEIRSKHKLQTVESILGYTLSPHAEQSIHINARIIDEPIHKTHKNETNDVKSPAKTVEIQSHSGVDAVQTVLGFTIPPARYNEIHTSGTIPIKAAELSIVINALQTQQLREQLQTLQLSNKLLKQQLQALQKTSSLQMQLFQAEKLRYATAFTENEARHLQLEQDLTLKLKQYQELYSQFETKFNDIQSQPISPKKEEKHHTDIITEVFKPSLLKTKSAKTENLPVWVKVREEEQVEKPAEIARRPSQTQSSPPSISRVSQMRKLFEGMLKSSSKKQ